MTSYLKKSIALIGLVAISMALMLMPASSPVEAQGPYYPGSTPSILPNYSYPGQSFTAASQTGTVINTTGLSSASIEVIGTSLTTATWQLSCSIDGGTNFFVIGTAAYTFSSGSLTTPIAAVKSSQTTTANTLYIANIANCTNVEFATTSGTFTGTSILIKMTASSNPGLL